jgi:hypothetical protein
LRYQSLAKVRAQEPGAAGDEDAQLLLGHFMSSP